MASDAINLLTEVARDLGSVWTGRIATADGSKFMCFESFTCDPETYAGLVDDGVAHGWTPVEQKKSPEG